MIKSMIGIGCIALSLAFSVPAFASPAAPPTGSAVTHDDLLTLVRGCHRDSRRHFVPEVRGTIRHYHRGQNCRPILDQQSRRGRGRDCHRDVDRHYLRQYGGSVVHRHVGRSCRIVTFRRFDRGGRNCINFGPIRYCER
jgi:hypothetical protein